MKTKLLITTIIFVLSQFTGIAITHRITKSNYEIILRTSEGTIRTWVASEKKRISPKLDRFYYGYYLNRLYSKQGELQGKPLNGEFCRYDLKENILESGHFKYGLKEGLWKQLIPGGTLTEANEYRKGMLYGQRVIYKNGKPDILEKYRKGKLIGKPKCLNPIIARENWKGKIGKLKTLFQRLFKHKVHKTQVQPEKKPEKKIGLATIDSEKSKK